ncbi:uncharacterized protein LOC111030967 [Myzus persicae]|uniref:uncharacterized protein LOC111030967 n=1 Tax=Myzus persicae TaxID=13164 RepID=UPI000B92FE24|nr:uncharacterized protein LOC111030967 [Myzus persicae]
MKRSRRMIEAAKKVSRNLFPPSTQAGKRDIDKLANKTEDKINEWLMSCEKKSLSNSSKSNSIKDTADEEQNKTDLSVNKINENVFNDKITNWLNACEPLNYNNSRDIINMNQDLLNISENTELTDTLFFSNTPENDLDIHEMDFIYNNDELVPDNNTPLDDLFPIVIQIPCTTDLDHVTEHDTPAKVSNISSNPEYAEPVQTNPSGRKRNKKNQKKIKQIKLNKIPHEWLITCPHSNKISKKCNVSILKPTDISAFKTNLCDLSSKIEQDKFLLTMMKIKCPIRTDRRKGNKEEKTVIVYYLPTEKGDLLQICSIAFTDITRITKRRLNILALNLKKSHSSPKEKRGGFSITRVNTFDEITISIKNHIESFKSKKSHYCREDTGRSYLQPGLSVAVMWKHWKKKREVSNQSTASLSKYYDVFCNNFNLSFGHPRQDVCSFCSETSIKIKNEIDIEKKVDLEDVLLEHKNKSKCFSRMMAEKIPNTVQVCFDMMQNQPLPKLSVTDTFYSRQAWVYNLTFVIMSENDQSKDNCYLYTWHEGESGRGPNEIGSALLHFLDILEERFKTELRPPTRLNLYSDSCSGKNKNKFIMGLLLYYMNCKETIFDKIKHIFPVRGHSYMAADQVFGRIEKVLIRTDIFNRSTS